MQDENQPDRKESCIPYFDAAWWCFTPTHQVQSYYINGGVDTCEESVSDLFRCLRGKMKSYEETSPRRCIPSIWEHRSVDEAEKFWRKDFKDLFRAQEELQDNEVMNKPKE